ncbi:MAG: Sir2 family NAD-dependent protein deacetylase [Syntrophales bacterium]|nr:Sir2 family NAD-dependent protein deacetylase [Syntrophales bacterium]
MELEQIGKLDCLITQNIDGLHFKAGNSPDKVLELHGTAMHVTCLDFPIRKQIRPSTFFSAWR